LPATDLHHQYAACNRAEQSDDTELVLLCLHARRQRDASAGRRCCPDDFSAHSAGRRCCPDDFSAHTDTVVHLATHLTDQTQNHIT
jgi:hypothetical protein